ncbi:uncharacterized protein [Aristolochia californica]|uniref:uncharacterized protein n=1 Tax=Aristolochia californica TaxID=171875 RepID=UPI0035E096CC
MDEDQEPKHCCRFCNKKFPCGRSLGGHMRSHMTVNSSETDEKIEKKKGPVTARSNTKSCAGFEGYGLRENPKKTWRFSDSSHASQQGKACKECGKTFPSWKALFGHMRCHSERSAQEDSWSGGGGGGGGGGGWSSKMVLDSQSDNEGVAPRRRRSRRARYGASPSFSIANGSSSISEIEQEQEDVAISLMMLSRDVGSWGGINSVAESSDNNSVVLEVRSSAIVKGQVEKGGDPSPKKKRDTNKKRSEPGLSDDMSLRNLGRRVYSDVSDEWLSRDDRFDEYKLDYEVSDEEMVKDLLKLDYSDFKLGGNFCNKKVVSNIDRSELGRDLPKRIDFDRVGSSKRANYNSCETELGNEFSKKVKCEATVNGMGKIQKKKSRFECTTCNKTFHSYQALGGHRASHKKVKGCFASKIDSSEASFEEEEGSPGQVANDKLKTCSIENLIEAGGSSDAQLKKVKGHECPICFKVFASGQALGGHKRSHLVSNADARGEKCQTIVVQQQLSEIPDLLDLNLPAPVEEDSNGFKSWWVGGSHKREPLVGLISN